MRKIHTFENFKEDLTDDVVEANIVEADYSKEQEEIINNLELDFDFIKTNVPIEPLYLFSEALVKTLNMDDMNDDKDSIVYITLCAAAILFEEPKESYKKMFEELRLRGVYGVLKPMVNAMQKLKLTLEDLADLNGKEVKDFKEIFEYTELFRPFMMAISTVIISNNIKAEAMEITDGLIDSIVLVMKELELEGDFKDTVDNIEVEDNGNDIKKYAQFKDEIEMIQDDKSH